MGDYDAYKRQVLEVSQMLSERGYFGTKSGSAGNVSVLIEGEEAIAVTGVSPLLNWSGTIIGTRVCASQSLKSPVFPLAFRTWIRKPPDYSLLT